MSYRTVQAAAEGMPSLSRRLFLRGAAVIAPTLALPATTALASSYAEENPALLALTPKIDEADARLALAVECYQDALAVGRRLWPRAPEEILWGPGFTNSDLERDITGAGFRDDRAHRYLRPVEWLRARAEEAASARGPGSKARRVLATNNLALAEKYHADCEHARAISGFPAADEEQVAAIEEVRLLAEAAHAEVAHTMAGVMVKAKSIRSWDRVPTWKKHFTIGAVDWPGSLVKSLMTVLEA